MFKVLNKQIFANDVKRLDVKAPLIAARFQPGQFVMIISREGGEWMPMAVADADPLRGMITFIVQENGPAAKELGSKSINEDIYAIIGPLGKPAPIEKWGPVVCVATGIGTAQILPICKALKKNGNKVIGILGAKTKRSLTLESQMRIVCSRLLISTEDGSYERRGLASDLFKDFLDTDSCKAVFAAGSTEMMRDVTALTKNKNIKTFVQPNPVMSCGLGFCGSCRVRSGGQVVLSCAEGPLFDGHRFDFDHFQTRLKAYHKHADHGLNKEEPDEMTRSISKFFPGLLGK